ncbi:unnamed protein product, partial [Discosporangium mesarthrocarpum]
MGARNTRRGFRSAGNSPTTSPVGRGAGFHHPIPSLRMDARCLHCDRLGVVYCKGCEAHFCTKHDQRKHRFTLRKNRHEHEKSPGISYFRIPVPNGRGAGGPGGQEPMVDSGRSDESIDSYLSSDSAAGGGGGSGPGYPGGA